MRHSQEDFPELVQLPMRSKGPFIEPLSSIPAPPRSLRALAQIIENDLCHRCGTCIGICPTAVLGADDEGYPVVMDLSPCTDCELCVRVCPGDEFNIASFGDSLFHEAPPPEDLHGSFLAGYLTHASDPSIRAASTSGGAVSALLISLLEHGEIDGALVIGADSTSKYKGVPFIARTPEEILSARGSKYAITPTNAVFAEILQTPGRYALVGLPCQIHGYHKAAAIDRRLKERIALLVGLLCHAAVEHEPIKAIVDNCTDNTAEISRFIYRDGKPSGSACAVTVSGKKIPAIFPKFSRYQPTTIETLNVLYRMYSPPRCLTCTDATAELADIAVGDPWMRPPSADFDFREGYSYVLARTNRGERLLQSSASRGAITLYPLSPAQARSSNVDMAREKKGRAFRLLRSRRNAGFAVPDYGRRGEPVEGQFSLAVELNLLSHWLCVYPKIRTTVLRLLFSPLGYLCFFLNSLRRRAKASYRARFARQSP